MDNFFNYIYVSYNYYYLFYIKAREKELIDCMQYYHRGYAKIKLEREFEKFIEFVFNQNWFTASVRSWVKDWWIDVDAIKDWKIFLFNVKNGPIIS